VAGSAASTAVAAEHYGVPGFASAAELAERDDIELIAITVRVPEHRRLLEPILGSRKAILCEWPLALDLAEAESFVVTAGVGPRFTGLQGHVSPTVLWLRELIGDGYLGDILSTSMLVSFPGGGPTFTSGSAYTADAANGATMMTISFAHALDMQTMLLGELSDIAPTIATLQTEALVTDTGLTIRKTAPDQLALTGRLPGGGVASMHFRGAARRTTPLLWEINGTRGSLRITGDVGLPMSATLRVEGAQDDGPMAPLELPAGFDRFPELAGTPAHNVAHLYAGIVDAMAGRGSEVPDFEDGVELHRALGAIACAAEGRS
jgi:predicted dehydrogenase